METFDNQSGEILENIQCTYFIFRSQNGLECSFWGLNIFLKGICSGFKKITGRALKKMKQLGFLWTNEGLKGFFVARILVTDFQRWLGWQSPLRRGRWWARVAFERSPIVLMDGQKKVHFWAKPWINFRSLRFFTQETLHGDLSKLKSWVKIIFT